MRAAVLATLVLILGACGSESATALPAPRAAPAERGEEGPLVAFLGDSLVAGLHVGVDQAFPTVLHRRLTEQGVPFRLLNAGVSGCTTAGGLRQIEWILKREPDVVVVELGGNDGLRGQPLDSIEANLSTIVERARARGAQVLLLGMVLPTSYGADYTQGFAALYERVAEEREVAFVPFFMEGVGGVAELNVADGIHPTPEGHRKLAENVEAGLRGLLHARMGAGDGL